MGVTPVEKSRPEPLNVATESQSDLIGVEPGGIMALRPVDDSDRRTEKSTSWTIGSRLLGLHRRREVGIVPDYKGRFVIAGRVIDIMIDNAVDGEPDFKLDADGGIE